MWRMYGCVLAPGCGLWCRRCFCGPNVAYRRMHASSGGLLFIQMKLNLVNYDYIYIFLNSTLQNQFHVGSIAIICCDLWLVIFFLGGWRLGWRRDVCACVFWAWISVHMRVNVSMKIGHFPLTYLHMYSQFSDADTSHRYLKPKLYKYLTLRLPCQSLVPNCGTRVCVCYSFFFKSPLLSAHYLFRSIRIHH